MSTEDDRTPESSSVSNLKGRRWFISLLVCDWVLLGILAHVSGPRILEPMMSVPPNRYFGPSEFAMVVAATAFAHQSLGWFTFLIGATAAYLSWKGRLDRLNWALVVLLAASCIAILGFIVYAESVPAWVEKTYGAGARERMFHHQRVWFMPKGWSN